MGDSHREKLRVLIVHPDMSIGGAERQIAQLLKLHDPTKMDLYLLLYEKRGQFIAEIENDKQINILTLPIKGSYWGLGRIIGIVLVMWRVKPTVVYSYLVNTNVMSLVAAKMSGIQIAVWGLRVSMFMDKGRSFKERLIESTAVLLSKYVSLLISNNEKGLHQYKDIGYKCKNNLVIANGIDTERFCTNILKRSSFREEIAASEDDRVICTLARFVEWKGYQDFIRAAEYISDTHNNIVFVCAGAGSDELITKYNNQILHSHPHVRINWLKDRIDVERILNGSDIFTLTSSQGDGFPNAIGEAMAVALPIVTTDVGDAAEIAADAALVVPIEDPIALANAWRMLIDDEALCSKMGQYGQLRVKKFYSSEQSVRLMERALIQCVSH